MRFDKNKTGLALGAVLGLSHLNWAVLVATGWAQPFLDWIFGLHFIQPPYTITPFHLVTGVILVAVTTVIGFILGWLFAAIWNWLHPASPTPF